MASHTSPLWRVRWATFFVALLAAASVAFWILGFMGMELRPAPGAPVVSSAPVSDATGLARALGGGMVSAGALVAPSAPSYQLVGVVSGPLGKGVALMAIDNAPPKAYSVGSRVEGGQVLQSVSTRGAVLGTTPLELPKLTNP
ncbi:MAG: type II secretion system protein N [Betaproteobacteria bacterium]